MAGEHNCETERQKLFLAQKILGGAGIYSYDPEQHVGKGAHEDINSIVAAAMAVEARGVQWQTAHPAQLASQEERQQPQQVAATAASQCRPAPTRRGSSTRDVADATMASVATKTDSTPTMALSKSNSTNIDIDITPNIGGPTSLMPRAPPHKEMIKAGLTGTLWL